MTTRELIAKLQEKPEYLDLNVRIFAEVVNYGHVLCDIEGVSFLKDKSEPLGEWDTPDSVTIDARER